ncbi:MAG TPA: hypothetical protein VM049_07125 [Gaiellaceae bacterium]|nr:hypothetical protein [Gaiellaceae bacterium]
MARAFAIARFPLLLTAMLAIVLIAAPGRSELAVHVYVLIVAALGLGRLLVALRSALPPPRPSAFDAALRGRARAARRIPELERMEREVALGLATAFDFHYRLRPRLRGIAGELLAARRGIELDTSPEAARRALGDDAWEIVRGDREPPRERFDPGVQIDALHLAVTALEKL